MRVVSLSDARQNLDRLIDQVVADAAVTVIHQRGGPDAVAAQLKTVNNGVIVVNAMEYRDLQVFTSGLHQAQTAGKSFLFRSAAAIVKTAAGITDQALLTRADMVSSNSNQHGGLIVFGSHVPKSNLQLESLLKLPDIFPYELPVEKVIADSERAEVLQQAVEQINSALKSGRDTVLFTSRKVVTGQEASVSLAISQRVSAALVEITQSISAQPRFLIAKGGITSSDIATQGLGVQRARVLGQILPGVPVWKLGVESRYPGMSYVVFPGNVGGPESVANVVKLLR